MSDLTWETIRDTVPCTYRQFDFWCGKQWIRPDFKPGTGRTVRTLPETEVAVLTVMADLVAAGVIPVAAAGLARQLAAVDVATLGPFHVSRADATPEPTEPKSQSRRASMGWEAEW